MSPKGSASVERGQLFHTKRRLCFARIFDTLFEGGCAKDLTTGNGERGDYSSQARHDMLQKAMIILGYADLETLDVAVK
jgi:hypothetical protein